MTPRRWIHCCNPELSDLISDTIGPLDEWVANLDALRELAAWSTDEKFVNRFIKMKRACKNRLKIWVKEKTGIDIPLDSLYDV